MTDDAANEVSKDSWISFSDILLTLVCALLFLRTLALSQDDDGARARRFEERLKRTERSMQDTSAAVEIAIAGAQTLRTVLGTKPNPSDAVPSPSVVSPTLR